MSKKDSKKDEEKRELAAMSTSQLHAARVDAGRTFQMKQVEAHRWRTRGERITAELRRRDHGDEFEVSDHALVRYIERVHGIDVEALRVEMRKLCKTATGNAPVSGQAVGHVVGEHIFVVARNRLIVTVIPANADPGN